jgi:hypothetical protein
MTSQTEVTAGLVNKIEQLVLYCIKSRYHEEKIYGENISIYKELKITFDGYSEDEEKTDEERRKSESYAVFIPKNINKKNYSFPEHKYALWGGVIHRPQQEVYLNVWFDRVKLTTDLEPYIIEDKIAETKVTVVEVENVIDNIHTQYRIQEIYDLIELYTKDSKKIYFNNLEIHLSDYDFDCENTTKSEQLNACAKLIFEKAERVTQAFIKQFPKRKIISLYISNEYRTDQKNRKIIAFKINTKDGNSKIRLVSDKYKTFEELINNEFSYMTPDDLNITLIFKFNDQYGYLADSDMLEISAYADIDCEAIIMTDDSNLLSLQGYDHGDYDTGIISNQGSIMSDEFLLTSKYNHSALLLQHVDHLEKLLNDSQIIIL